MLDRFHTVSLRKWGELWPDLHLLQEGEMASQIDIRIFFCMSICNSIHKQGCLVLQGKKENWGYLAHQGPLDFQVWRENQVSRDSLVYRVHQVHQDYQGHLWKVLKVALAHQVFQEGQVRAWSIPINICQYFHILLVGYQPLNFLNLFGWVSSSLMA